MPNQPQSRHKTYNQEIQDIISKIHQNSLNNRAYLGFTYNDEFGYAKGNKEGLLLYAAEFLKAAHEVDLKNYDHSDEQMFKPSLDWMREKDENPFVYIQLTKKAASEIKEVDDSFKSRWYDKLIIPGCIGFLILGIILSLIGLITFIGWL